MTVDKLSSNPPQGGFFCVSYIHTNKGIIHVQLRQRTTFTIRYRDQRSRCKSICSRQERQLPYCDSSNFEQYKVKRGTWKLTSSELKQARQVLEKTVSTQMPTEDKQCFIPEKDSNYVPFGNFTDLKKVVKSKSSTLSLSRVFLATVKPSLLSRHVLNLIGS